MAIHILGIRHHGPGSARNVKNMLEKIRPDIVLVEGPPEADDILQWVTHKELKPPVAILCYQPDNPQQSSFYPFAEFSPEWQAISYARKNNIHVRFMDLPMANHFAVETEIKKDQQKEDSLKDDPVDDSGPMNNYAISNNEVQEDAVIEIIKDPMSCLAEAAGYEDGERWWEYMFEHRHNNEEIFDAVNETMQALREAFPKKNDRMELLREAHMRKVIRQAEKEMFQHIAVICGAWHAPALLHMPKQKDDNDLLKGLPKVKVECTWIPWTYNRLSYYSGYGAGITSPGWYEHIWKNPKDDGTLWMAKVAKLFREKQMDTSVAHVIEAVRLAESLASLRNLHKAGLEELNEATLSVLCNGENILLALVNHELIVSDKIGEVPEDTPKPPLQLDIEKTQKRLRLPVTADWKDYILDLRKENDLERSIFLHRLQLLDIKWGQKSGVSGKGTFKEQWRLQWDPAFSIDIIEKGTYGNTTEEASSKYITEQANKPGSLSGVCVLLENCIPAELPAAIDVLIRQINNLSAASGDVIQLMEVIPGLVNVTRYGNVRKTDTDLVLGIVNSMITRICISLPAACTGIDEDAAEHLLNLFFKMNDAVNLLQQSDILQLWQQTLSSAAGNKNSSPVIAGYATRLLVDYKLIAGGDLVKAFYYAMSAATAPAIAAAWLEGFLKGSGTLLLIDNDLWSIIDNWIKQLGEDVFTQLLPLLRRTFSNFSGSERRKLGEKVKAGGTAIVIKTETNFDEEQAKKGIPVIMQLFGYKN
ncbi:MAG: DUF5682 family protein [Bacteroidota bacterium]|nr:DUF5682 family protein [Bacteroidota bacterium]